MQPRIRATLVVAAIAIASAIAGAAIDRTFLVHGPRRGPRPGAATPEQEAKRRGEMLDRLSRDLALSAAQRASIDSVFQRSDSVMRGIRREMQPRIRQVLEQTRAEIAGHLDSAQRVKMRENDRKHDAERGGRP
jgi:hypothetical protein